MPYLEDSEASPDQIPSKGRSEKTFDHHLGPKENSLDKELDLVHFKELMKIFQV
jgi:hypothetical protein